MDARIRRAREGGSPERVKTTAIQPRIDVKRTKKVQVFYYLSRNGQLEQPHLIEVTHFAHQPLRLKDVKDRLTVLRGKAMPSLYSWSCKRSYRGGYVWNDLSENDVVYPAEGAEYVLKGSELVEGSSENLQQIHVGHRQPVGEPNGQSKTRKPLVPSQLRELDEQQDYEEEYDEVEEYEYEDAEKTSYTTSTTPHSRCSRGVSTEELEEHETRSDTQKLSESTRIDSSRLSTTSPIASEIHGNRNSSSSTTSSKRFTDQLAIESAPSRNSVLLTESSRIDSSRLSTTSPVRGSSSSKRFTDCEQLAIESAPSRNSVLLQFIACGSSTVSRGKTGPNLAESVKDPARKAESLRKGVIRKIAGKHEGEEEMINYMSENPRFGNLQSEEKEYFSGSIVESMRDDRDTVEPALKKSNSYNEERSKKAEMEEMADREEKREEAEGGVKGKCIPRIKSSSSKQAKKP